MATPPSRSPALPQQQHQQHHHPHHHQLHQHHPNQHAWSAQPPFPNKDPLPLDSIFQDPFQDPITPLPNVRDPLPFSLAPAAHPQQAPTPPQQPSQPPPPPPQPSAPQPHLQQPWQDPQLAQPSQLPLQPLQQQPLPQPLQQPLQQPSLQTLTPPLPSSLQTTHIDNLSPTQRRKLRIELRRARLRTKRALAPPRPDRPTPALPVPVVRSDRPTALDKKALRVIRNREVALKARQAAKTKMKNLEEENSNLKNRATTLEVENSTLKSQIEMLRKGGGGSGAGGGGGGGGIPWEGDLGLGGVVNAMTN